MQIVIELDPVGARFLDQHSRTAIAHIDAEELELLLVARLPLNRYRFRARKPIDAREIPVAQVEVDIEHATAFQLDDTQLDASVRRSGGRVALPIHPRSIGVDLEALHFLDRAIVDPRERDAGLVGRPPIACIAIHFFLRDELRHAVLDESFAVRRQCTFLPGAKVDDVEILIANEAYVAAVR